MPRRNRNSRNHMDMPDTLIDFHNQLITPKARRHVYLKNKSLYAGLITNAPDEGLSLIFLLPNAKHILTTGATFAFKHLSVDLIFEEGRMSLLTIFGVHIDTAFPIGFVLMSRKSELAYTSIFYKLLSVVQEWKPRTIIIDFDPVVIASVKSMFTDVTIQSCWFSLCREIIEMAESVGIGFFCSVNRKAYNYLHKMMAVPFLPSQSPALDIIDELHDGFISFAGNRIADATREKFKAFTDKFKAVLTADATDHTIYVSGMDIFRLNVEIEVSFQHTKQEMNQYHHSDPWSFIKNMKEFTVRTVHDYEVRDGGYTQTEDQTRQIWIHRVPFFTSMINNFNENRCNIMQFLDETIKATPNYINWNLDENHEDYFPDVEDETSADVFANMDDPTFPFENLFPEYGNNAPDPPPLISYEEANSNDAIPLVSEECTICLTEPPIVVAFPCMHQYMCGSCYFRNTKTAPHPHKPYYRCPICRAGVAYYASVSL